MKAIEFGIKATKIVVFKENTPVELLKKLSESRMPTEEIDLFYDKYFVREYIEEGDSSGASTVIVK